MLWAVYKLIEEGTPATFTVTNYIFFLFREYVFALPLIVSES